MRVFGCDWDRMDDEARTYADFDGHRSFMRMADGHCAALRIDLEGPGGSARFRCAVYAQRPDVCRALERGSGACRADRHEKRERPLIAVSALLRR